MVSFRAGGLASCGGEPDHQGRDRDDAQRVGCEPVLPSDKIDVVAPWNKANPRSRQSRRRQLRRSPPLAIPARVAAGRD